MPSQAKFLVALRGTPEYERALERLLKAAQASGQQLDNLHQLGELALAEMGTRHGVLLPRRMAPRGTNQHTPKA